MRQLSRGCWALIVFIPLAGPIGWLMYGRPNGDEVKQTAPRPKPRVVAPDDDPDFLRSIRRPKPKPPEDTGPPTTELSAARRPAHEVLTC